MSDLLNKHNDEYKKAVRWLMEARAYKKEFEAMEYEGELVRDLAADSDRAFNEAGLAVLCLRKKITKTTDELIDAASKKRKTNGR